MIAAAERRILERIWNAAVATDGKQGLPRSSKSAADR
jgi:hypothetical protein